MTIVTLAPKPTVAEEVRESVVGVLKDALAQAEAGNVTSVLVIALHPDGNWSDWHSSTEKVSEMVGRLEIAKQKRIMHVLNEE